MSKKSNRVWTIILVALLLSLACTFPTAAPEATSTPTLSSQDLTSTVAAKTLTAQAALPTLAPTQIPTEPPEGTPCPPYVTAKPNVNVRIGPGQQYQVIGVLTAGSAALVFGQNDAGTWWYVVYPKDSGKFGWVAASVTNSYCIPEDLPVVTPSPAQ